MLNIAVIQVQLQSCQLRPQFNRQPRIQMEREHFHSQRFLETHTYFRLVKRLLEIPN